jgi:hypothetical protein
MPTLLVTVGFEVEGPGGPDILGSVLECSIQNV